MAKASKKTAFTLDVGNMVKFVKYANPLPKGQKPLFKPGDSGKITAQENLGPTDDPYQSYMVQNERNGESEELYFPDEIIAVDVEAEAEAEAEAAVKEPAPKKVKAEPKAETKAEPKAVAKKAAPKKAAVVKAEVTDTTDELVLTNTVSGLVEGGSAIEAARDLLQNVSTSYFSLGGVLAYIQSTEAYRSVKRTVTDPETGKKSKVAYDNFFEFCAEELGQEEGKTYQLIRIYRKLSAAGIDEARFLGIGWTYARKMSTVITSDNADELLGKAQQMSRDDFEDWVQHTYVKDGIAPATPKIKRGRYDFTVHGDQVKTVDKVLSILSKQLSTDDRGAMFHHLCVSFLQEQGATTLEQDLAYLSETHGVVVEVTGKVAKKAPAKSPAKATSKAKPKVKA